MRGIALLSLMMLAACASGSTTAGRPETMRVVGGGGLSTGGFNMNATSTASTSKIAFPIDAVWRALPAAYDSLKIPPTTLDPKTHHFGNEGLKIRQKLGGVSLSRYIDCGQAQIGPSADSYDIFLNITTTLNPSGAGETEVSTMVEAAAKPLIGQDYTRCTSKGTLENTIAAIVAAKLAAK